MIQKFNLHTHTFRCKHAKGEDEEYVLNAIKMGFKTLGFSDHIPYPGHDGCKGRMNYVDRIEYYEAIKALKLKYQDQINILLGFESEYYPYLDDYYKEISKEVDYLILGQHDYDVHYKSEYFYSFSEDDYDTYADNVIKGLNSGLFKVLCHPDYVLLNVKHLDDKIMAMFTRIFKEASRLDIPIEINLNGMSDNKKRIIDDKEVYAYPKYEVIKLAHDLGCSFVFGIDAHDPKSILEYHKKSEEALNILSDIDLRFKSLYD